MREREGEEGVRVRKMYPVLEFAKFLNVFAVAVMRREELLGRDLFEEILHREGDLPHNLLWVEAHELFGASQRSFAGLKQKLDLARVLLSQGPDALVQAHGTSTSHRRTEAEDPRDDLRRR
jgi:hypothetical protein